MMDPATPATRNIPRSWIHDSIGYAPGGPEAVAEKARLPLERVEAIMRGRPADDAEAVALARALGVPQTLIFIPPSSGPNRALRRFVVWTAGALALVLVALLVLLFGLWRYAATQGISLTHTAGSTVPTTRPSAKRTKPQAPILPNP